MMTRTLPNPRYIAIALALSLAATSALVAQPPAPRPPRGPGFGPGGPDVFLERMAEELELSEAQIAEIDELVETHRIETAGLRAEAEAARASVREVVEGDLFDETAIRAAAERAAGLQVELTVARARLKSTIRSVLTAEQQAEADELKAERRQRVERFRDWRRPHRGRAPRARG